MRCVVIESPLSAANRQGIEDNKVYAKRCLSDSLRRGEAPFASHLLYDQSGILDDLRPDERETGMRAGFEWGSRADMVAVYVDRGISPGMERGIEIARHRRTPIQYRALYKQVCRDCGQNMKDGSCPNCRSLPFDESA